MKPLTKWAWNIGRLAVGIGLAAWIFHRIWNQPRGMDSREWAPHWFLLMLAGHLLYLGAYLLGITRWRLLLRAHDIRLGWGRCFTLFFLGHFFNAFLLGATGGDVMKAYYAARETHHRKTEAVTTVFLDRLLGLVALVILVLAILTFRFRFLLAHPMLEEGALYLLLVLAVIGLAITLMWRRNWLESGFWKGSALTKRLPASVRSHGARIYAAVYHFKGKPALLAQAFGLSLGVHILSLLACCLFASAIRSGLTLFQAFTLYPLLGALGAIPITPGGLGVREGAAVVIFGTVGIPPLTAFLLSLIPWLSITLWSLFGGLLYLAEPWRKDHGTHPSA
jgi:glycosyltransferase 2 family protein